MENNIIIGICIGLIGLTVFIILAIIVYSILKSPFKYPYCTTVFDVSGKRQPNIYNLIDEYLIQNSFSPFYTHYTNVLEWKKLCENYIENSKLKKLRLKQYKSVIDDENMFHFKLVRNQTRYRQVNYVKSSYTVKVNVATYYYTYEFLKSRFKALSNIGFECTLSDYNSKEQRKRMTKSLRDEIAQRDNYTCQICGKYMPDGVGLHIDHIIPITKGGKSIPSNLQVLCSKCNGRKSIN